MSGQKIMIFPICLGIFLAGIVMIPNTFAADGCGPGTVLIDGVCELAPAEESSEGCGPGTVMVDGVCELAPAEESSEGCGPGTVMVDGVCELDEKSKLTSMSIEPLYIIIAVVAIGGVIGAVLVAKKGSKTPKPAHQELKRTKISAYKESSESCQRCGTSLKPDARFCGKCGTPRS